MLDKNNEVFFEEYCKTCKYKNYSETDSPCAECIAEPVNLYSHKPIRWEGANDIFSGPPPRPDHAYQRAVKYVPEKRKDKEKAIARQNIDAEYTGNKVQNISESATDDQYPSATAVKKALEGQNEVNVQALAKKIDAPSGCKCGEFLAVEEVDEKGVVKKVKAAEVQTDPPDWNENDPEKPGYIENRTHYFKVTKTEIGSILFKATSSSALVMENPEDTKLVRAGITEVAREHSNIVEAVVNGNLYKFYVGITMGVTTLMGVVDDSNGWAYDGPAGMNRQFKIGENASLVVGDTYDVMFYWRNEFCKTLDEMYFPKTIFTQNNSPVKFGTNKYGDIIESTIQGIGTVAQGACSHAEGAYTKALGDYSHAEGNSTKAQKSFSHAEGFMTTANGETAHAEGSSTQANNHSAHAEGDHTIASGKNSHAEGGYTIASAKEQHAQGKYNIEDTVSAHIVGNGESDSKRSNAHTLDWEGNAWFAGDVYVRSTSGTNKDDGSVRLATIEDLSTCFRVNLNPTENDDGTVTYVSDSPASFMYYVMFGLDSNPGNSIECYLNLSEDGIQVLNFIKSHMTRLEDGNMALSFEFSSYVSDKQISAEIKDTISGFNTDNEKILSTVVTVTENALVSYSMTQELTYEQQALAKQNIGAGTLRNVYYWSAKNDTPENPNSVMRCAVRGDTCICREPTSLPHGMIGPVLVIWGAVDRGYRSVTVFDGSNATWIFTVDLRDLSYSTPIKKSGIPTPTTAQVGQIIEVKAVDTDGKITETETVDIPNRLDVTVSMGDNGFVVSHKFAEIKAAYDAGRAVQLIDTDTFKKYSLMNFYSGSSEGITDAYFRFIDSAGDIWVATINSNDEIELFNESTFVTLYGDVPTDTPKAITYSSNIGIGYADFIPYIEIPNTGDELKERLVISHEYFYVMPNAYAPFVLKNLVNPYTLTRLSYSEPEYGTEDNTYEASYLVTDSLGQQIKATCQVLLTESELGDLVWNFEVRDSLIVKSSTEGSTKKFKITVDDSGTISATEITN